MQGGKSEQKNTQRREKKMGATRLRGVAGRKRDVSGLDEDETTKIRGLYVG